MIGRLRQVLSVVLVVALLTVGFPGVAAADIHKLDEKFVSSPTNPGEVSNYASVWREGWGNSLLPQFDIKIPSADPGQPAIVGGYYYINRPSSLPASMNASLWQQSYWAPISNATTWRLDVDIPSEVARPSTLFDSAWVPSVAPSRTIEGPFATYFQFVAKDTTTAAAGAFGYGLDVTPPQKVTGLQAIPGVGNAPVGGWLTQSRVLLVWDDKTYDGLAGTGYFEAFLDGKPWPVSAADSTTRKVYDLKEHYPGYGFPINTKRQMAIEDLPAGIHTVQIRAVDRATNEGPLSDPVTIQVDPDMPAIDITSPDIDGQQLGATPTFSANVTDAGGTAAVGFSVDGVAITTDTVAPYTASANLSAFADGSTHTLRVTAVDVAGRSNFASKAFVIDKKPVATMVFPSSPAQPVSALVPLKVAYKDKTGVTGVVFRVDGALVASYVPGSAEATEGVAMAVDYSTPGLHNVTATVSNAVGGTATVTGSFFVDSTLRPDISTFAPASTKWYDTEFPYFTQLARDVNSVEMLYRVDRAPMTVVDPSNPSAYDLSYRTREGATLFTGVIDQNGVYLSSPVAFDGRTQFPGGATKPTEGVWYVHALMRDANGQAEPTVHTAYGVDVTPPAVVTGLAAYSDSTTTTPVSGWLQQSRVVLRWNGAERDSLSGVDHYNLYVDGERVGAQDESLSFQPPRSVRNVTIEDMLPGVHKVVVTAVDKAGNESAPSAPATVRIYSAPQVTINNPASVGATLPTPAPLRATVTDASGIQSVTFSVDGVLLKTFTPASVDTTMLVCGYYATLPSGLHNLVVTATSQSGPQTTTSRAFMVDATLPPDVEPPPGGGTGGGPVVTPAFTWFNTAYPQFTARPSDIPTDPTELLYLVDRSNATPIDPTMPNLAYGFFSPVDGSTYFDGLIDQMGVYLSDPAAFDGELQMPGRVSSPIEGIWYVHAAVRNADGAGSPVSHVGYGVDITKPAPVSNVALYSSVNAVSPVSGWVEQSRVVVRWDGSERDALSGTDHYIVYVDGTPIGDDGSIKFQRGRATMSLTIETLTPGRHTIAVTAVDEAGNESALSNKATIGVDAGAPSATFVYPAAGAKTGAKPSVSVLASDAAGIARVDLYVDNVKVGVMTKHSLTEAFASYGTLPPLAGHTAADFSGSEYYVSSVDLSAYSTGNHTLKAVAYDSLGATAGLWIMPHSVATTRTFYLDATAPTLSTVSGSGYHRTVTVRFTSNESGVATVRVDGIAKTIAVKSGVANVVSITVPKRTSPQTRVVTWSISASDAYGNRSGKAGSATVRYYDLIRTSTNSIRIVYY